MCIRVRIIFFIFDIRTAVQILFQVNSRIKKRNHSRNVRK
ncbi:hypothetical protein LEP1GSC072_2047 [Leptospira noguchii str. Bonito]|nr:hypothetical protein LEP1GSC072_2047 [Leptospira noguchii str. Bonito]